MTTTIGRGVKGEVLFPGSPRAFTVAVVKAEPRLSTKHAKQGTVFIGMRIQPIEAEGDTVDDTVDDTGDPF